MKFRTFLVVSLACIPSLLNAGWMLANLCSYDLEVTVKDAGRIVYGPFILRSGSSHDTGLPTNSTELYNIRAEIIRHINHNPKIIGFYTTSSQDCSITNNHFGL